MEALKMDKTINWEDRKAIAADWFKDIRNQICAEFE